MVVCNRRHMLSSVVNQQVWDTFETEKPVRDALNNPM